ncbi:MAG: methyltransferase domain-containing protein [Alphaproteobacteria bacterium]|nr:methyltransferase domain-containing protein [Alphaproteobacteria bacterium]
MLDMAKARALMVEAQVRTNDVTDQRIIEAMSRLPRERFVPESKRHLAYSDACVHVAGDRSLLDPRSFAKLAQLAEMRAEDRVLDVACGYGYSTAVFASMASDVVGLEEDASLASEATRAMREYGAGRARIVEGPLDQGCAASAPYDVIFINGAVQQIPAALISQLRDGGRLLAIFRDGPVGKAHFCVQRGGALSHRVAFDATVPLLQRFERSRTFVF